MTIRDFMNNLSCGIFDARIGELYGSSEMEIVRQKIRLTDACEHFAGLYPECEDIKVVSVPACVKFGSIPLFLSADRIIISGEAEGAEYISGNIPENLSESDMNELAEIHGSFPGYSLCYAGTESRVQKKGSDAYMILYTAVYDDEKKRSELEYKAIESGNTAEFFRIVNGSSMHTLCSYTTRLAVLTGRNFLDSDGAVMAENNIVKSIVPAYMADEYLQKMAEIFGSEKCHVMKLRSAGRTEVAI